NTLATYIPWLWHQLKEGVTDVDGHSHPMRDLAGFLDLAADMGFLIIPRPGPYIMAETINEGVPPWVFSNYPQVAFVSQDERPQNIASYLHPDFLACVEKWYEAVFAVLAPRQVTRGGRIIMIQLDNEMGMPHWVRNILDVNPDTIARFATYLEDTFGSQLPTRYPADNLPAFLREGIVHPSAPHAANIVADYCRFYREYLYEYADFLWRAARANGMEVLPIVNIHGFTEGKGGKTFPIGLSQLIKVIEMPGMITATDVYPIHIGEGNFHQLLFVNEATKALQNKEQALFSVEFQSGGNNDFSGHQSSLYDLHSRLCISVGMRAINHYSFFAGENDPILSPIRRHDWGPPVRNDGTVRRHYARYRELSQVLDAYGEALILSRPHTVTTIGFLLDNFMTEVNNAFTQEATAIIAHQRECVLHDFIARGLALTHRPFDALDLSRSDLDVAGIPALWVMMDKQCPATVQQKLVEYANQGGNLILAGRICEEDLDGTPSPILRNALGIEQVDSDPPFVNNIISAFHYPHVPVSFVESYTGRFDDVFARRGASFRVPARAGDSASGPGEVVGFVKALGKGRVMMFGAALPADTLDDLNVLHQMALKMDCHPLFELSEWADVRASRSARGTFLFINNYQDDPISTTLTYEGETLFGSNPVHLPARRGLILPLEWHLDDDVVLHYATGEVAEIAAGDASITLKMVPAEFTAELTLAGYRCDEATVVRRVPFGRGEKTRVQIYGTDGRIVLWKDT
ncbi:MAG: beta-galactosidase, partial [Ardenticatenaceae bacterium]